MRFGLMTEGEVAKGTPYSVRYHEVIKEAVFAEEMGFDFWGTSEQHLVPSAYSISAPEVLYGAVAAKTSTIKLRHASVVMLPFNNPVRIAERIATLDIVSKGRVEFGTARSNNIDYIKAFGVDPSKTRGQWRETVEATVRALMESPFEFHGEHYDIDPIDVTPKLYGPDLPPLYVSATSTETHRLAGELGIGSMTFDNWFGWGYVEECVQAYREGLKNASPIGGFYDVNPHQALLTFPAHCAATRAQAIEEAESTILGLLSAVIEQYRGLAQAEAAAGGSEYAYMQRLEDMEAHKNDIEYLIDASPALLVGDPDQVIERIKRYEAMGIDEVLLKIDNYGHAANMRSIEMFGKHVFPEFKNPRAIPQNDWEAVGVTAKKFLL